MIVRVTSRSLLTRKGERATGHVTEQMSFAHAATIVVAARSLV